MSGGNNNISNTSTSGRLISPNEAFGVPGMNVNPRTGSTSVPRDLSGDTYADSERLDSGNAAPLNGQGQPSVSDIERARTNQLNRKSAELGRRSPEEIYDETQRIRINIRTGRPHSYGAPGLYESRSIVDTITSVPPNIYQATLEYLNAPENEAIINNFITSVERDPNIIRPRLEIHALLAEAGESEDIFNEIFPNEYLKDVLDKSRETKQFLIDRLNQYPEGTNLTIESPSEDVINALRQVKDNNQALVQKYNQALVTKPTVLRINNKDYSFNEIMLGLLDGNPDLQAVFDGMNNSENPIHAILPPSLIASGSSEGKPDPIFDLLQRGATGLNTNQPPYNIYASIKEELREFIKSNGFANNWAWTKKKEELLAESKAIVGRANAEQRPVTDAEKNTLIKNMWLLNLYNRANNIRDLASGSVTLENVQPTNDVASILSNEETERFGRINAIFGAIREREGIIAEAQVAAFNGSGLDRLMLSFYETHIGPLERTITLDPILTWHQGLLIEQSIIAVGRGLSNVLAGTIANVRPGAALPGITEYGVPDDANAGYGVGADNTKQITLGSVLQSGLVGLNKIYEQFKKPYEDSERAWQEGFKNVNAAVANAASQPLAA